MVTNWPKADGSMTDVSQGPGWWLGTNGRWYAPEQHPDFQTPPPPPPALPPPLSSPALPPGVLPADASDGRGFRHVLASTTTRLAVSVIMALVVAVVLLFATEAQGGSSPKPLVAASAQTSIP